MVIALTGFMGCGKSSVGRELAKLLPDAVLVDLDGYIEERQGKSIPCIFESEGEEAFRSMEEQALREILTKNLSGRPSESPSVRSYPTDNTLILSLGGGTLTRKACADMVHERTICIYLKASIDTLESNLTGDSQGRPMLSGDTPLREKIASLMEAREAIYEKTAHITLDMNGLDYDAAAALIIQELGKSK